MKLKGAQIGKLLGKMVILNGFARKMSGDEDKPQFFKGADGCRGSPSHGDQFS
jgi:hypothetical protein